MMYAGMRVIVSENALTDTTERLFPASKNRSARIRKKLIKRFGGEFRKKPAAFKTPAGLVMHPEVWRQLQERVARQA